MSTWECRSCTAAYAPGAPGCPQCGTNDPIDEAEQLRRENEMPKITVHSGPSNADAEPGQPGYIEPTDGEQAEETGAEQATDGDVGSEVVDYNDFHVEDLKSELSGRGLPVSGKKDELVARLTEDDKARADEAEVAEGGTDA